MEPIIWNLDDIADIISSAKEVYEAGEVLVYPTDTLYGFGVDPTDPKAMKKLIELKGRSGKKPVSIAVSEPEEIEEYAEVSETAWSIIDAFMPGPITIVLPSKVDWFPYEFIGIRVPDSPITMDICASLGPLTATSANIAGEKDPIDIYDVLDNFGDRVGMYIQGDLTMQGKPSTVVRVKGRGIKILREGVIPGHVIQKAGEFLG